MMRFRFSKSEFKKYLQDYFNCEYTKEEDVFYEDHWHPADYHRHHWHHYHYSHYH